MTASTIVVAKINDVFLDLLLNIITQLKSNIFNAEIQNQKA